MNIRKVIISLFVVVGVILLSVMLSQYFISTKEIPESNEKEQAKLFVRADTVIYTDNQSSISATGRLSSQHAVDLSSEVSGQILQGSVNLKKGKQFKEGDILVRIFAEEQKNNLKATKSRFLNAIAGILPDMKIDFPERYDRWNKFFNDININEPLPELPEISSDKEKIFLASRNILNDYYSIISTQIRSAKFTLRAPFNGTFTDVMMEVGSVVNPGSRIATMIKTDKLELEVPIKMDDIYWVNIGDNVKVETKDGLHSWNGTVIRKSNYVDPNSQSISVFVSLEPTDGNPLYQGQYLRAIFSEKNVENSMEIPRNAIFNKNKVFTIDNGKLKKDEIKILKINENTALFSGLEPGSLVVVEPLVNAKEGANAEILN